VTIITALAVIIPLAAIGFLIYLLFKAGGVKVLYGVLLLLLGFWLGRSALGPAVSSWLSSVGTALHINPHIHQ
jgi:hypothetical protein